MLNINSLCHFEGLIRFVHGINITRDKAELFQFNFQDTDLKQLNFMDIEQPQDSTQTHFIRLHET